MASNPLAEDLDFILDHTRDLWEELRGERVFITGGTGFFGCWLLESLAWANDRLDIDIRAVVLTRSPADFQRETPHLISHPAFSFLTGDVRTFPFPQGNFAFVIHAATEASARLNLEDPLEMVSTIVDGTTHALAFAQECAAERFLLTSSGAIYGRQPPGLANLPEDFPGGPDPTDPHSAYAEGKRLAELLTILHARQSGPKALITRGFTFVGPYLPLDAHYAVGNFIRDGLSGGPLRIQGDGKPIRSYLYAADLAVWLWTILFKGIYDQPYNVGSEDAIDITGLARRVAQAFDPPPEIRIANPPAGGLPERYVPCTQRARQELGLQQWTGLDTAIQRTVRWARDRVYR